MKKLTALLLSVLLSLSMMPLTFAAELLIMAAPKSEGQTAAEKNTATTAGASALTRSLL